MYRKIGTIEVISLYGLQQAFPDTSFPAGAGPDDAWLSENGYERYNPPEPEQPAPTYRDLRATAYPPVQEQLDMQYWDAVNGTTNWLDMVAAIKAQYPKE